MIAYFDNEKDAVGFANDINETFGPGSASITIITPELYAVSYVSGVIGSSSEDTEKALAVSSFFKTQANT